MRAVVRGAAAAAVLTLAVGGWSQPGSAQAHQAHQADQAGQADPADPADQADQVDLGGQSVRGSTDPADPTHLDPGLWQVDLGAESAPLHFVYQRRIQNSTIHIGAVGAPQGPDGDGLALAATDAAADDPEGDDCGSDTATTDPSAPYAVFGTQVIVGNEIDQPDSSCPRAAEVAITLSRYSSYNDGDLPVALKVVEEAPVSDEGEPRPDSDELDFTVPDPAETATDTAGAPSFADAPLVDPRDGPVTIETTVREGSELLWRVPATWGDQLVARVDLSAVEEGDAEGLGYPNSYVRLSLVQPSRDVFALTGDDYGYGYYGGTEASRLVVAGYPLRYPNRYAADVAPVLPGDQWVSVAVVAAPEDRPALDVPITLTLAVTATDAKAPTYQAAVLGQGGGAGPAGYSADEPYLVGDGEFAAVASGNPVPSAVDDDEPWWSARHVAGLGLGAVSLACCAVGLLWLRRRRSV